MLRGVSRLELLTTTTEREMREAQAFEALYDLPDAFHITSTLGPLIAGALGSKVKPSDFATYFKPPPKSPEAAAKARAGNPLASLFALAEQVGKPRDS
jgi:hypothetical protein